MKETKDLNRTVKKYLLNVFLNSNFEDWEDGSELTYKNEKQKTSILVGNFNHFVEVKFYLHNDSEEVEKTSKSYIGGSYTFNYDRRVRAIHYLHFFYKTRKVKMKIRSIRKYFKEKSEYKNAKAAFNALPTSYQRKEKLEAIGNENKN